MGRHPIVTLLTDFGERDPFAGVMKGVILTLCPEAHLVDLTHGVGSYDILAASFLWQSAVGFFPHGTIHVAVVDPGVGGPRRPIAATIDGHYFVAPDNGLLSYPMAFGTVQAVRVLTASEFFLYPVSATFHGRDVFAAVAGHLARGITLERLGPLIADAIRLPIPTPRLEAPQKLTGQVIWIDQFGNCVTNIRREELDPFVRSAREDIHISLAGRPVGRIVRYFGEVDAGSCGAVLGSTGYLEVFIHTGSLAREWGIVPGAEVSLEWGSFSGPNPGLDCKI